MGGRGGCLGGRTCPIPPAQESSSRPPLACPRPNPWGTATLHSAVICRPIEGNLALPDRMGRSGVKAMAKTDRKQRLAKIADELWRKGEPAKVERSLRSDSTVLSVRMPRETLRYLTVFAREQGKGPGTLARELIEQGLSLESAPSSNITARVLGRLLEVQEERRPWATQGGGLITGLLSSSSPAGLVIRRSAGPGSTDELLLWPRASFTIRQTTRSHCSDAPCVFSLLSPSDRPSSGWWRYASLATLTSPAGEDLHR